MKQGVYIELNPSAAKSNWQLVKLTENYTKIRPGSGQASVAVNEEQCKLKNVSHTVLFIYVWHVDTASA